MQAYLFFHTFSPFSLLYRLLRTHVLAFLKAKVSTNSTPFVLPPLTSFSFRISIVLSSSFSQLISLAMSSARASTNKVRNRDSKKTQPNSVLEKHDEQINEVLASLKVVDEPPESSEKKFPNPVAQPTLLRASLFRSFVLADYVTMANAVCGVSSIFLCLNYLDNTHRPEYLLYAFILIPLALFFDIFDGWVARKQKSFSPWGSDLDSLADVVSFVVCPAVLGFTLGLRGMWDSFILCFFVFCGIARLARYNVTSSILAVGTKVPYYEGFPVPTSLALVALWYIAWCQGAVFEPNVWLGSFKFLGRTFHPFSLLYLAWGCLFVSASVRIPKP